MSGSGTIARCLEALKASHSSVAEALGWLAAKGSPAGEYVASLKAEAAKLDEAARSIEETVEGVPEPLRPTLEIAGCLRLAMEWVSLLASRIGKIEDDIVAPVRGGGWVKLIPELARNALFTNLDVKLESREGRPRLVAVKPVPDILFRAALSKGGDEWGPLPVLEPPEVTVKDGGALRVQGKALPRLIDENAALVTINKGTVTLGLHETIVIDAGSNDATETYGVYVPSPLGRLRLETLSPKLLAVLAKPSQVVPSGYRVAVEGVVGGYRAAVAEVEPWDRLSLEPGWGGQWEAEKALDSLKTTLDMGGDGRDPNHDKVAIPVMRVVNRNLLSLALDLAESVGAFSRLASVTMLSLWDGARVAVRVPEGHGVALAVDAGPHLPGAPYEPLRVEVDGTPCGPAEAGGGGWLCSLEGEPVHVIVAQVKRASSLKPRSAILALERRRAPAP